MNVGTKLVAIVPIQLSEDEAWTEGTPVEIVERCEHEPPNAFGSHSYELQAADGSIGSFAEIDIAGEFAWFRAA